MTRRRNAATTREAILASAREAFVRAGYDGVGLREIAGHAGVTAMLVGRYFGSKEALFAEVVAQTMAAPAVLTDEVLRSPSFARELAVALLGGTCPDAVPVDGFLLMLRSAANHAARRSGANRSRRIISMRSS